MALLFFQKTIFTPLYGLNCKTRTCKKTYKPSTITVHSNLIDNLRKADDSVFGTNGGEYDRRISFATIWRRIVG